MSGAPPGRAGPSRPALADGLVVVALGLALVAVVSRLTPKIRPLLPMRGAGAAVGTLAGCDQPVEARGACGDEAAARLACAEALPLARAVAAEPGDVVCLSEAGVPQRLAGRMRPSWRLLAGLGLDINGADPAALCLLPRVGPRLAERIVADRRDRGPFARPEDLRRVAGIGPKVFADLRPLITVAPAAR